MSEAITFEAMVWRADERTFKTFITLPFDVKADFGRARCPVLVDIAGYTFHMTTVAFAGGFHLPISTRVLESCDLTVGDLVKVEVEVDDEPPADIPEELAARLRGDVRARDAFDALTSSKRSAYAEWVGTAKWPEARRRRANVAADLIRSDDRWR